MIDLKAASSSLALGFLFSSFIFSPLFPPFFLLFPFFVVSDERGLWAPKRGDPKSLSISRLREALINKSSFFFFEN